jgi:L-iditol 2-dehydrogenase
MKHTYPRAIQLTVNRQVDLRPLITHRFRLNQAAQAFQVAARYEGIKVIIEP